MVGGGTFFLIVMVQGGIFFLQVGNYYPSQCGAGRKRVGADSRRDFFKCLHIKGLRAGMALGAPAMAQQLHIAAVR